MDSEPDRLLVVTATEWRNLCARGLMRVWPERLVRFTDVPSEAELDMAFASAPTTKLDSASDLLVLVVARDPAIELQHPAHPGVTYLGLCEVVEHHVVSQDVLDYYASEGAKAGVTVRGDRFDAAWRRWKLEEGARDTVHGARALVATAVGRNSSAIVPASSADLLTARRALGDRSASQGSALDGLLTAALEIDDAAASTRTTESYYLVAVLEWAERRAGVSCWDLPAIGGVVRASIASGKTATWDAPHRLGNTTRAALDLMEAAAPAAFEPGLDPLVVGSIVRLRASVKEGGGDARFASDVVRALIAEHRPTEPFSIVASALLGLERIARLRRLRG